MNTYEVERWDHSAYRPRLLYTEMVKGFKEAKGKCPGAMRWSKEDKAFIGGFCCFVYIVRKLEEVEA